MTLRIVPLYPELLSIYADRGNVCVLEQRARWRGLPVEVVPLALGESFDPDQADVVLIGGGQDRDQALVAEATLQGQLGSALDYLEGVGAFMQKRAPVFTDR